jgi:hypothetical protein
MKKSFKPSLTDFCPQKESGEIEKKRKQTGHFITMSLVQLIHFIFVKCSRWFNIHSFFTLSKIRAFKRK